jgi:DNA repair protein RadA/Sms
MAKARTVYRCQECGYDSAKWIGRCPRCDAWSSFGEAEQAAPSDNNPRRTFRLPEAGEAKALRLPDVRQKSLSRKSTGIGELDRVLGGGLVPGSLILIGGEPGIGKSTLLLDAVHQLLGLHPEGVAYYISGEESPEQIGLRAERMGISNERLLLLPETRVGAIASTLERDQPMVAVVDSIQSVYDESVEAAPGTVSQIRESAARFLYLAKSQSIPIVLVGHVTKEGSLAGPRLLEHMVDTVLYFESAPGHSHRILRAHKNRFGATNEIGVFEMQAMGLVEVPNPSELFLAERPVNAPGSVILPALEGTRPVLVEVQSLVSDSELANPRRTCLGFESSRAALLVAVLERRAGLDLRRSDVFVNVPGGLRITEPAADLAVSLALVSSFRNRPLSRDTAVFGEVGLTGEIRAVPRAEARIKECEKLGFRRVILPKNALPSPAPRGMTLVGVRTLEEALEASG